MNKTFLKGLGGSNGLPVSHHIAALGSRIVLARIGRNIDPELPAHYSPLTATCDIRLPRDLRRTPLPDTEGNNTGEPGWNTSQSRDFNMAIH